MTHRTLRQVLRQEFLHQVLPREVRMLHKVFHFRGCGCRAGDDRICPFNIKNNSLKIFRTLFPRVIVISGLKYKSNAEEKHRLHGICHHV